ncbi:hypothetical protein G3545_25490 [Starkeya sp. ORNL1]|uniref:hypothetical protein n=1 Tax=Starkeya sp. ORNL1 TaxID=2709380 RepID=UPI00146322D5|nr:hypothetical protein [Starkeya sp. ORNL1]QJP16694.1 hypothetical protein G3545_25490 [Starkeya sp. ORNL1]
MNILLAFAPFLAFALIDRLVGATEGLVAAAIIALAMVIRDRVNGRSPKILEIGTALLFGGLAAYALFVKPDWSILGVRLRVDAGLLLIVLATIALRQPFTLQYARESVAPELWDSPQFLRTNYVITAVWALAFAVLVIADLVLIYRPDIPPKFGIFATVLALLGAARFTRSYPDRVRANAA